MAAAITSGWAAWRSATSGDIWQPAMAAPSTVAKAAATLACTGTFPVVRVVLHDRHHVARSGGYLNLATENIEQHPNPSRFVELFQDCQLVGERTGHHPHRLADLQRGDEVENT